MFHLIFVTKLSQFQAVNEYQTFAEVCRCISRDRGGSKVVPQFKPDPKILLQNVMEIRLIN